MHEPSTTPESTAPSAFTNALTRSSELLWQNAPLWFKIFFGWWLFPLFAAAASLLTLGQFVNDSKAEVRRRQEARQEDFRSGGI